ncbi:IMPACT family protein [Mycoplasmopsis alligatoris]|uniref:Impact N-terminal domain-containing protein n=1 Tax=Mycoplasmopsis alligatoris A21JP2 TaxID=747682 RepID=D4XVF9_9BACT|nr:YigZ family protein [Mycoplasmopsis alligatoris]EFF41603.1 conserved hypothetical protein [Mycoplasmopsis alligatoris A21JP2]
MNELIVKKSRFISQAYSINSKEQISKIIDALWVENKKARHICYAFLYKDQEGIINGGFNDDGEPKNTAGKAIYDLINLKKADNLLVVTIRYFGGIKLGAGGLIKAYRKSASIAIDSFLKGE